MTITRTKPLGFSYGQILSSPEANALDANIENAVDRRSPGLEIDARSVTRTVVDVGTPVVAADWSFAGISGHWTYNGATGAPAALVFALDAPHGSVLTAVGLLWDGPAHGGSWPPANRTQVQVYSKRHTSPFTAAALVTGSDSSVQATYEAEHEYALSTGSITIDREQYTYSAIVLTENGANAVTGSIFKGLRASYTVSRLDEG